MLMKHPKASERLQLKKPQYAAFLIDLGHGYYPAIN